MNKNLKEYSRMVGRQKLNLNFVPKQTTQSRFWSVSYIFIQFT